jgi:acetyltransferase-like isoleucine patch superfamily enzyme
VTSWEAVFQVIYRVRWSIGKTLSAWMQGLVRRHLWHMDIDASAIIEPSAYVDRTWPRGVHIGADCYLGEQAVMLTHDMVRGLYLDTRIGARTVLGARSVIMPGLIIGEDCRVAPGAVVIKDMPNASQAIGNPAQVSAIGE